MTLSMSTLMVCGGFAEDGPLHVGVDTYPLDGPTWEAYRDAYASSLRGDALARLCRWRHTCLANGRLCVGVCANRLNLGGQTYAWCQYPYHALLYLAGKPRKWGTNRPLVDQPRPPELENWLARLKQYDHFGDHPTARGETEVIEQFLRREFRACLRDENGFERDDETLNARLAGMAEIDNMKLRELYTRGVPGE